MDGWRTRLERMDERSRTEDLRSAALAKKPEAVVNADAAKCASSRSPRGEREPPAPGPRWLLAWGESEGCSCGSRDCVR